MTELESQARPPPLSPGSSQSTGGYRAQNSIEKFLIFLRLRFVSFLHSKDFGQFKD
jgi:hypothetical protein